MGDGQRPGNVAEPRRESVGTGVRLKKLRLAVGLAGRERGSVVYLTACDWMERRDPRLGMGLGPLGATSSSGTLICI